MKITSSFTGVKAMVAKLFTVGLLAGAVVMAAPSKADAQVSFGVRFGAPVYGPAYAPYRRPVYVAPPYGYGYYHPGFYGRYGWDRHERFEHFHRGW